jgi:hypothetical protein
VVYPPGEGVAFDADGADTMGYVMRTAAEVARGYRARPAP